MVYVVFALVVALGCVSLVTAIAGLCSYFAPDTAPSFLELMAGVATLAMGAAIIVCTVYSRLPLSTEAYAIPVTFCVIGVAFIIKARSVTEA
ncbi:MAG: hypothetical protein SGJ27_12305 [Candidatus Melainabacteria bacterium]|nr:hypothetical protein [Candidatus Melainabacteria bacterium]